MDASTDLEHLILSKLARDGKIDDTYVFSTETGIDHQTLVGVVKSLLVDRYVADEPLSTTHWTLTAEGKDVAAKGSPEIQVLQAVQSAGAEGLTVAEVNQSLGDVAKIGMGVCMKNKWLAKQGDRVVAAVQDAKDETADWLRAVDAQQEVPEATLQALKKRKLVTQITRKSYRITKGPDFREQRVRKVADLTRSMLEVREQLYLQ